MLSRLCYEYFVVSLQMWIGPFNFDSQFIGGFMEYFHKLSSTGVII